MKKLLCIGDIFLDILASPFPIAKEKILSDGETFVDYISFQRGGCSGNFVAVLKSIFSQITVDFVSRVGNDPNAEFLIQEMERYGVNQRFIKDLSSPSAITIAVSYNDGERHFITNLGALEHFTLKDIPLSLFEKIDHLAYRGIWFMDTLLKECPSFLQHAMSKKIPISMDLGFDPFWNLCQINPEYIPKVNERKQAALNALPYISYLFGNEKELQNLTNQSTLDDAIRKVLQKGVRSLIIHRGSKGAAIVLPEKIGDPEGFSMTEIPAASVKVINPVGSGDTFDSIFIGEILEGKNPIQAAALASAGAAYSLQSPAGTKITLDAILSFIAKFPPLKQLFHYGDRL